MDDLARTIARAMAELETSASRKARSISTSRSGVTVMGVRPSVFAFYLKQRPKV
jgi:hypothetical protein